MDAAAAANDLRAFFAAAADLIDLTLEEDR
jgi:hypothetical protein